jgi:hypothetical protein
MMASYYVVETSGDLRQMWGPYASLSHARAVAGVRHVVVTGSSCRDGRVWRRGELQAAQECGSVRPVDESVTLVP